MSLERPLVGIIMGSTSDASIMKGCGDVLHQLGIPHELKVLSAHRTPDLTREYVSSAADRGIQVLIAGAGWAAHLAGFVAAHTILPVIGVPIDSSPLGGIDALLSTVQMPPGIPGGDRGRGRRRGKKRSGAGGTDPGAERSPHCAKALGLSERLDQGSGRQGSGFRERQMKDARVVRAFTRAEVDAAVSDAVGVLRSDGVVAFPTETFYGLGADISRETAIRKVFEVKSRGHHQPLLILIPSLDVLPGLVSEIPPPAKILISALWPGALTLVFRAAHGLSPLLTAETGKIGIRLSSHPLATAIAKALGGPITGTSANVTGAHPCRDAQEVKKNLGNVVDLILDGGAAAGAMSSTLLDVTAIPPRILREGAVSKDRIRGLIRLADQSGESDTNDKRSRPISNT